MKFKLLLLFLFAIIFACDKSKPPEGLRKTPEGNGPRIIFDLHARPLPEIPFPNDIATIPDEDSPTGLRLSVSTIAPTELESRVRKKINTLNGFSIYSYITVAFDKPLDLNNIKTRHSDLDFTNDAFYLINIDPESPHYGRFELLDVGNGNFPLVLEKKNNYFEFDPRENASNLIFETYDEDLNGNGLLDPGEDTDFDGVLDKPNVLNPGDDPDKELLTFYEKQTNTLLFRNLLPLDEETTYAVVLTDRLVGENGEPVRSPFEYINHTQQTKALKPLEEILPEMGLSIDNVAFTWVFTTQSTTRDMVAIRKGLYGSGPLKFIKDRIPDKVTDIYKLHTIQGYNSYTLPAKPLTDALRNVASELVGDVPPETIDAFFATYDYVDYFVAGEFLTPYFLIDRDGIATEGYPADDNEVFDINPKTGRAVFGEQKIPFFCAIPKQNGNKKPPYPVAFYMHGYTSSRFEMLGFAGSIAKFGIATCSIDAVGHGLGIPPEFETILKGLFAAYDLQPLGDFLVTDRARDLNNDGVKDSGGDFWTADTFHTRDVVRQSIVDYMQFIRVLRQAGNYIWDFDTDGNGVNEIALDFNADGVADLGGLLQDYHAFGSSLGGILSSILAGIEPAITSAAPVAGGGGLIDIGIRSVQGGVVEAVFLRILGPLILGLPDTIEQDKVLLKFLVPDVNERGYIPFYKTANVQPGDKVVVRNLKNNKEDHAIVSSGRTFRLQIPADAKSATEKRAILGIKDEPVEISEPLLLGDPLEIIVYDPSGNLKEKISTFGFDTEFQGGIYKAGTQLVAPAEGFGYKRNTPDLRRFMAVAQMILDPGDPISYAPHYVKDIIDYSDVDPELVMGANVMDIPTIGDMNVPVNTGIAIARAAGFINVTEIDPRYGKTQNQVLIDSYVIEGLERLCRFQVLPSGPCILFDVDNLSDGLDGFTSEGVPGSEIPRLNPPLRVTVRTPTGVSGMRIPYMSPFGQHGFNIPHPEKEFNMDNYMINKIGRYFETRGQEIVDDICLADNSCNFILPPP